MKQPLFKAYRRTVLLLTAWVFIGLVINLCPAGVTEGMTRAEVIERWGLPRAQLSQGNREYFEYGDEREVELRNGIVQSVKGAIITPLPEVAGPVAMSERFAFDPEPLTEEREIEATESMGGPVVPILMLFFVVFMIAASWKIYRKAGRPGWVCLVPIYNMVVLIQIAGKSGWWFLLMFFPVVQLIAGILVGIALAERFGKSVAFGLGLVFLPLIFYPILGFGGAHYTPHYS